MLLVATATLSLRCTAARKWRGTYRNATDIEAGPKQLATAVCTRKGLIPLARRNGVAAGLALLP